MKSDIAILGAGWLGMPLAKHFSDNGHSVNLATRSHERLNKIKVKTGLCCIKYDIENIPEKSGFLDSETLIININCKNIEAFGNLIDQVRNSRIRHVLFISSTSVYKNVNGVVSEDSGDERLDSPLYRIEQLFMADKGFKTTILRLAGLIGPGRHPGYWFVDKPVSQPDTPVNLIHRDDCISIIKTIVDQGAWGEVFNGCVNSHPNKRDFYNRARALLGKSPPDYQVSQEVAYKLVSNTKLLAVLQYSFIYPDLMELKVF